MKAVAVGAGVAAATPKREVMTATEVLRRRQEVGLIDEHQGGQLLTVVDMKFAKDQIDKYSLPQMALKLKEVERVERELQNIVALGMRPLQIGAAYLGVIDGAYVTRLRIWSRCGTCGETVEVRGNGNAKFYYYPQAYRVDGRLWEGWGHPC